jgi:cell wall-associated NlpC family hydrolase
MSQYRPGDVVARRKGPVMHKGIVMADGRILHNIPLEGEQICSLADFGAGKRVYVTRRRADASTDRAPVIQPNPSRRYCLFTNNCEHTVTRFTHERPCSPQLRGWIAGMSVAAATLTLALARGAGRSLIGRMIRV